jgi:hypothetical protein
MNIISWPTALASMKPTLSSKNAARQVIKDAFNYGHCISVASYYTQVNLLPFARRC